eukprot:COSAG02_NODE_744_length_17752_cov_56.794992_8_plen_74_part_00
MLRGLVVALGGCTEQLDAELLGGRVLRCLAVAAVSLVLLKRSVAVAVPLLSCAELEAANISRLFAANTVDWPC